MRDLGLPCFVLIFQLFTLPPATVCDGAPDWVTRIATGKQKMILVALKRSTVSCVTAQFVPVTRSSCCLFSHHPAAAPAAGLLWMASTTGNSLTSNQLRKPPRSPCIPTLSVCSAVKTDTFYRPWHLAVGSARARNSGEGRAPHQFICRCQVGNVFLVSASVTYAVSSLLPPFGDSSMLPFSLGDMMPIFSLDT